MNLSIHLSILAMQSVVEGPTRSARLGGKRLERKWRITEEDISPNILEKKTWKEVCFSFQTPYLELKGDLTVALECLPRDLLHSELHSSFENITSQLPEGALEGEPPLGLRLYSLSPFQDSVCSQTRLEGDAEEQR